MSLEAKFQAQLERILANLKSKEPAHSMGPRKPSLGQQESGEK